MSDQEKFHSLEEGKRPKFLVSWIEEIVHEGKSQGPGLTRGQTCITKEEVNRLMGHLQSLETTLYCETRRIGSKLGSYSKRVDPQ